MPKGKARYDAKYIEENVLEGIASLVLQFQETDEIQLRLKAAYWNPKLLLKKKITENNKIRQLSRLKDQNKLVEALSPIIYIIKDLQRLASEQETESCLFSSNGIKILYQFLGNSRIPKWFSTIYRESCDDEDLWLNPIQDRYWCCSPM